MHLTIASTAVLVLEVALLVLLGFGVYQMRVRHDQRRHGLIQAAVTIINLVAVLLLMVPSLLGSIPFPGDAVDARFPFLLVHHSVGLVAIVLSVFLTGSWLASGTKPSGCPGRGQNKRRLMRATYGALFLSIVLGIVLYILYL
jgi:uncharacterized membrane protein YozB (DUF420 family)